MKPGSTFFKTLLVLLLLLVACAGAFGDEITVNVVSQVLQSFDPDEAGHEMARDWVLLPSKFGYDAKGNSYWQMRKLDAWPEALYGKNRDKEKLQVLGITGKFSRKGYNYVEIVPGTGEGQNFKPKPDPHPRQGRVRRPVGLGRQLRLLPGGARPRLPGHRPRAVLRPPAVRRLEEPAGQGPGQHPAGLEVPAPPAQPGADQAGAVDPARRKGRRVLHVPRPDQDHHRPVRNLLRRRRAGRCGDAPADLGHRRSNKEER